MDLHRAAVFLLLVAKQRPFRGEKFPTVATSEPVLIGMDIPVVNTEHVVDNIGVAKFANNVLGMSGWLSFSVPFD